MADYEYLFSKDPDPIGCPIQERRVCGRVICLILGTREEIDGAAGRYCTIYPRETFGTDAATDALFYRTEEREGKKVDIYQLYLIRKPHELTS